MFVNALSLFIAALKYPADWPTGAIRIETSAQLDDKNVFPVQRHLPFMQAPFLLQ